MDTDTYQLNLAATLHRLATLLESVQAPSSVARIRTELLVVAAHLRTLEVMLDE